MIQKEIFDLPVVLMIFNRPETTRQVFAQIAQVRPRQLFIIADGPRADRPSDIEQCATAQALVQAVNWECQVNTDFSPTNLGLKRRVSTGLDWVFSNVEHAIILEDDCIPHHSFFYFASELLERYRLDQRVMMIAGTNYQFGNNSLPYSYYFSIYPHIWGWATWARAWKNFDVSMRLWPEVQKCNLLASLFPGRKENKYWTKRFQATYEGQIDTWDYCWTLACWLQHGLTIIPNVNLVSNIGFGSSASHTKGNRSQLSKMTVQEMQFPLAHPPFLAPYSLADAYTQRIVFKEHLLAPLKRRIKKILVKG